MRIALIWLGLLGIPAWSLAAQTAKVGYGSSTAVMAPAYQENVLQGFQLGLEKVLGRTRADSLLVTKQVGDKSLQGATVAAESLVADGAVFLVGFPTSHDALLAADVARKHGLLALFGAAAHTALAEKGPLVYTTGASMNGLLDILYDFLAHQLPEKRGLAVVNPYNVFSANQEKVLVERRATRPKVSLQVRRVTPALILNEADLKELKEGKFDYLYFTLYPDDLVALLTQLTSAKVDLPMVAWGGPDPAILKRLVTGLKSPYYIGSPWNVSSPQSRALDREIQKRYRRASSMETSIGYDLGVIVGQTVARVKGPLTKASVAEAFQRDSCFEKGLARGKVCFGPRGGHAEQSVTFARFTASGLEPEPPKP